MTGKKIKIALCLSGEPRSSMFCFPYLYESFLSQNPLYETDVYFHSFKGFRSAPLFNSKSSIISNEDETELFKSWVNPLNQFDEGLHNKLENSTDILNVHSTPVKNLFLMFYGISKTINLIKNPEEYQVFIRCRFDIFFESKFFIDSIIQNIVQNKYDIFLPKSGIGIYPYTNLKGFNDQIAIMNSKATLSYAQISSNLTNLINKTQSFKGEEILLHQFQKDKIIVNEGDIDMRLIRRSYINSHPSNPNFLDQ